MRSVFIAGLLALTTAASVSAHGYLSSPACRGCNKATYQVDDLKSPNGRGICRGEPAGPITQVAAGATVNLGFTITAPHVGPCAVSLLNLDLSGEQQLDTRMDCAAPGKVRDWAITIPASASGRRVLRWTWEGCHVQPCEKYEQCVDLDVSGGGGGAPGPATQPDDKEVPEKKVYAASASPAVPTSAPVPAPVPETPAPAQPVPYAAPSAPSSSAGACQPGEFTCQGDRLGQCSYGSWVWTGCPPTTKCINKAPIFYCGTQ
ncbi:hypothetical protein THASP1DRAFT_29735 [Thamnocephalis sphaerospora]|uniref:Chitin-binding type-4 domain-containing protein n=1 Tax=Thamnocephalis sphaerospora TaxID=78915 RepID=A0A4P9XQW9_9FUNG|nr:hypothetical protein THASP1DRAFT_29735 [Thamnocephalis sphaerospora]|eukprot:RKP08454.1 hypothetical protein THASP1DRAFT_29735 [Thamnocephalis sphaerospora]